MYIWSLDTHCGYAPISGGILCAVLAADIARRVGGDPRPQLALYDTEFCCRASGC